MDKGGGARLMEQLQEIKRGDHLETTARSPTMPRGHGHVDNGSAGAEERSCAVMLRGSLEHGDGAGAMELQEVNCGDHLENLPAISPTMPRGHGNVDNGSTGAEERSCAVKLHGSLEHGDGARSMELQEVECFNRLKNLSKAHERDCGGGSPPLRLSETVAGGEERSRADRPRAGIDPSDDAQFSVLEEEEYIERLTSEVKAIQALPLVLSVRLYPEDGKAAKLNDMGVQLQLKASFISSKREGGKFFSAETRRRPNVHCNAMRPTQLEAVIAMRAKLEHEYEAELTASKAAEASISTGLKAVSERNVFNVLMAVSLAQHGLERALKEAIENENKARLEEEAAEMKVETARLARATAARRVLDARAALGAMRNTASSSAKRQKKNGGSDIVGNASASLATHQGQSEGRAPRPYESYSHSKWNELEAKVWGQRRVELTNKPGRIIEFQRGPLGPLEHWRRGLVGAVQDWAEGSREDAVKLIVALVERLKLKDEVLDALSGGHLKKRETKIQIADNVIELLSILKWSRFVARNTFPFNAIVAIVVQ